MSTKTKSKWKNSRKLCSAINCMNYQFNSQHLAFHRFPANPDRCARWVQNLRNVSLKGINSQQLHQSYRVCSAHFDPSQFKRPSDVHAGLKWDAVPTKDASNHPPPLRKPPKKRLELSKKSNVVQPSNAASPSADSVSETDITTPDATVAGPSMPPTPLLPQTPLLPPTPLLPSTSLPTNPEAAAKERTLKMKIRNLESQVCKLKKKVREHVQLKKTRTTVQSVLKQLKELLPAKAYAFMSTQIRVSQCKALGFRWTSQEKAFFLALLQASPKCYKLLFDVFSMPSVRTLQKLNSAERRYTSQDSPRIAINSIKVLDDHSYVNTDCREAEMDSMWESADPVVTANTGATSDQVEEPMDYPLDSQFDSH